MVTNAKILEMWNNNYTSREIGDKYGLTPTQVNNRIRAESKRTGIPFRHKRTWPGLLKEYLDGMTTRELSEKYNRSTTAIHTRIREEVKRQGIPFTFRSGSHYNKTDPERKKQILYWRSKGLSYVQIGRELGVTKQRVSQLMQLYKKQEIINQR